MDAKTILDSAVQFFNDLVAPPAAPPAAPVAAAAPAEYEIKGGGKVTIDKLEAGGIVMIDGSAALPGDLELADGTKLTIGDNGVISAIELGAPAPDAPVEDLPLDMGAKFSAFETASNQKFAAYEAKLSAYEQRFAANEGQLGEYKAELGKHKEMIEKLLQFGKLMVDAPAAPADPATKVTNNFKNIDEPKKVLDLLFS